jgi:hypothetical protein
MHKNLRIITAVAFAAQIVVAAATQQAWAQTQNTPYPSMAPLADYLIPSQESEIALARSAAPKSISGAAEVMVLGRDGYTAAATGTNGFVCIVERSWADPTTDPEFWNPKVRAPNCFNAAAAKTFLPIYLMKTQLVLAGKSKADILNATSAALHTGQLPPLAPDGMVYMMSRQQYLNDTGKAWHPHLMFLVPGDHAQSWGANLPDSPVLATNDLEEQVTIFMVVLGNWSDGTPAPRPHE